MKNKKLILYVLKASVENTLIAVMLIIQCGHFYNVRHQIYKEHEHKTIWTTSWTKVHLSLSQQ